MELVDGPEVTGEFDDFIVDDDDDAPVDLASELRSYQPPSVGGGAQRAAALASLTAARAAGRGNSRGRLYDNDGDVDDAEVAVPSAARATATARRPNRLTSRGFHVTYAGLLNDDLTHEHLVELFTKFGETRNKTLLDLCIGKERHASPRLATHADHYHVYVRWRETLEMRDRYRAQAFDVAGHCGHIYHPEIQPVPNTPEDRAKVLDYVRKDGHFVTAKEEFESESHHRHLRTPMWAVRFRDEPDRGRAAQTLLREQPHVALRHYTILQRNFAAMVPTPIRPSFTLDDFQVPPLDLHYIWLVYGESNTGKTSYALAHMYDAAQPHRFPIVVNEPDDFKDMSPFTSGIVIDDMALARNFGPAQVVNILSNDKDRSVSIHVDFEIDVPSG